MIFALSAVLWPVTHYSSHLKFSSEISVPASAGHSESRSSRTDWTTRAAATAMQTGRQFEPLTHRYVKRQVWVHAAVPTYQSGLADAGHRRQLPFRLSELPLYALPHATPPSDRGPPLSV